MVQVALYRKAPSIDAIPIGERYTAAIACIAEGVTAQKPALISAAHRYLTRSVKVLPAAWCRLSHRPNSLLALRLYHIS